MSLGLAAVQPAVPRDAPTSFAELVDKLKNDAKVI